MVTNYLNSKWQAPAMTSLKVTCKSTGNFCHLQDKTFWNWNASDDECNLQIILWFSFDHKERLLNKEYILSIP
jgi:hypothetical protein